MFRHDVELLDFTSFDGTHIVGQRFGHGPQLVVLANGLGGSYLAFEPLIDALAEQCTFLSWDYRGLYGSGKPADIRALTMADHARDLLALMDHTGTRDAVWLGWSMGVQVNLEAYRLAAERCRGLVLLNGTYGRAFHTALRLPFNAGRFVLPVVNELGRIGARPQKAIVSAAVRAGIALPVFKALELVNRRIDDRLFIELSSDVAQQDFDTFHRILAELDRHDGSEVLGTIRVPVTILAGDRDMMTPHRVTDRMVAEIPHAKLHVLPQASHYMLLEAPGEVCSHVREFLDLDVPDASQAA